MFVKGILIESDFKTSEDVWFSNAVRLEHLQHLMNSFPCLPQEGFLEGTGMSTMDIVDLGRLSDKSKPTWVVYAASLCTSLDTSDEAQWTFRERSEAWEDAIAAEVQDLESRVSENDD